MTKKNEIKLTVNSRNSKVVVGSIIDTIMRGYVSSFANIEETLDIKVATIEAVANAMDFAYPENTYANGGDISISIFIKEKEVKIVVKDKGVGIDAVEKNKFGFSVMKYFADKVNVTSKPGKGTTITLFKKI